MPKNAEIHIHSTAPGPPVSMAATTPTILPVPTVPEIAAENASNWLMEFAFPSFWRFCPRLFRVGMIVVLSDSLKRVTWRKPVLTDSRRPVASMRMITGQPHTKPFMVEFTLSINDMMLSNIYTLLYRK